MPFNRLPKDKSATGEFNSVWLAITVQSVRMGRMPEKPITELVNRYQALLDRRDVGEGVFQAFLEEHPEFLVTPFLLNHDLHFSALISQYRLSTSFTADFAYLTKSSIQWRLVLVEIERPDISLFLSRAEQVTPTSEFGKRIAQVHEWKDEIGRSRDTLFRSLDSLRRPLERNALDVRYLLVIGRSVEPFQNQRQADRLVHIAGEDVQVSTFDSLLRHYVSGRAERKNVLSLKKGIVHFKHLHVPPTSMFAHLYPHELSITVPQASRLRSWGYDIPAWQSGNLLGISGKKPLKERDCHEAQIGGKPGG